MSVGKTARMSQYTARGYRGKSPAMLNVGSGRGVAQVREGKRGGRRPFGFQPGSFQGASQVIIGIGVTAREAGRSESKDGLDLFRRDAAAQQLFGDPQVGDAPIGRRETLRNAQPVQPTGIDSDGGGRFQSTGEGRGWRGEQRLAKAGWREGMRSGVEQSGGLSRQERLSVDQSDPGSVTAGLATCGLLIGESSQPSEMTSVGAGGVCAVQVRQVSGNGGGDDRFERSRTDTHPGLQMAGAGADDSARRMPARAHGVDEVVVGAIEIDQDVSGVSSSGEGPEEDVIALAITQPEKAEQGAVCELESGPNLRSRKGPASAAMNQTKLIIIARHGRQLSAHGLQGDKESAIHARDSIIGSGTVPLKAEVLTLQKSGSFHFALTPVSGGLLRVGS